MEAIIVDRFISCIFNHHILGHKSPCCIVFIATAVPNTVCLCPVRCHIVSKLRTVNVILHLSFISPADLLIVGHKESYDLQSIHSKGTCAVGYMRNETLRGFT